MSSDINIERVRETYAKKTDAELTRVLLNNAAGLTPEAIDIVKAEIKKRGLDPHISDAVDAQNKVYGRTDIDAFCEIIQNLPCPVTGDTSQKLNITLTSEVMSFILFTNYKKRMVVGPPDTLRKANNDALIKTALLGWWGLPWGIIRTVPAIFLNIKNQKISKSDEPSSYLREFVEANAAYISLYKDNSVMLSKLIGG